LSRSFPQNKKGARRAPRLPDPETKSRVQQLRELPPAHKTQMLLAPLRFQKESPELGKLVLFAKEGFPIKLPEEEEQKRLNALVKSSDKAPTTKLYIPGPFLSGTFRNVEDANGASA
jgi:hypothetical protein